MFCSPAAKDPALCREAGGKSVQLVGSVPMFVFMWLATAYFGVH